VPASEREQVEGLVLRCLVLPRVSLPRRLESGDGRFAPIPSLGTVITRRLHAPSGFPLKIHGLISGPRSISDPGFAVDAQRFGGSADHSQTACDSPRPDARNPVLSRSFRPRTRPPEPLGAPRSCQPADTCTDSRLSRAGAIRCRRPKGSPFQFDREFEPVHPLFGVHGMSLLCQPLVCHLRGACNVSCGNSST